MNDSTPDRLIILEGGKESIENQNVAPRPIKLRRIEHALAIIIFFGVLGFVGVQIVLTLLGFWLALWD